jgi:HlyD family secretion protein
MKSFPQRTFFVLVLLAVAAVVIMAMLPKPVAVDLAEVGRGPLVVTITDDGRTRIRERYVVSAPLSGRLVRIRHKPGNEVIAQETLLTTIEPTDPGLLDPRTIAQSEARVNAAEARLKQSTPRLESARVDLNHAETELGRIQQLANRNAGSQQAVDAQQVAFRQAGNSYSTAQFELEIAGFELEVAKAALSRGTDDQQSDGWNFPVKSPISGRVLRVFQESATIVNAGDRILEVGDPTDLEVEVDVLSTDAVRIRPGNRVMLEQWGGGRSLPATVRLIEPSAFTKVSALGIEEQRVNVIIDFTDPPESRPDLADGYRVEAAVVEWESPDVLKVPVGALFRDRDSWAVFIAMGNRVRLTHVELGHRNDNEAEVVTGLGEGARVVLYPGDRIEDGVAVKERSDP